MAFVKYTEVTISAVTNDLSGINKLERYSTSSVVFILARPEVTQTENVNKRPRCKYHTEGNFTSNSGRSRTAAHFC